MVAYDGAPEADDGAPEADDGAPEASGTADGDSGDGTSSVAADGPDGDGTDPTDAEIVAAASDAAEELVFSRYRRSDVRDVDVAVSFEDGLLEVDVYLNVPDADVEEHLDDEAEQVADDAALAALDAVDRLFEERGE